MFFGGISNSSSYCTIDLNNNQQSIIWGPGIKKIHQAKDDRTLPSFRLYCPLWKIEGIALVSEIPFKLLVSLLLCYAGSSDYFATAPSPGLRANLGRVQVEVAATAVSKAGAVTPGEAWELPESLQNGARNGPFNPFILSSVLCQYLPLAKPS